MYWHRSSDEVVQMVKRDGIVASTPRSYERREIADMMWKVWTNDLHDLVDQRLRSMFEADENYNALKLYTHTATNPLRRIVCDICRLYQEPAIRYLKGQEPKAQETGSGRIFDLLAEDDLTIASAPQVGADGGAVPGGEGGAVPPGRTSAEPPAAAAPSSTPNDAVPAEGEPDAFAKWIEAVDLDQVMGECDQLSEINPAIWIFPRVALDTIADGSKVNRLLLDIYTPSNAAAVVNPKDRRTAVGWYTWREEPVDEAGQVVDLVRNGQKTARFYYLYTATTFQKYDAEWKPVGPELPNPLNRLPVVAVRAGDVTADYYLEGQGGDLFDATLEICCMKTLETRAFRDASFKQLAIEGDPEKVPAKQVMGNPAIPIYLGEGAKATTLDFAPQLAELRDTLKDRVQDIATTYGISPASWTMSERAQSGHSKRMDQASIIKRNRKKRKHFAKAEAELYTLCALRLKAEPVASIGSLDVKAEMIVDFADPKFEEDPDSQAKADARDIESNKISIVDVVQRDNPELSEVEALQLIARNRLINQRFVSTKEHDLLDQIALSKGAAGAGGGGKPFGGGAGGGAP